MGEGQVRDSFWYWAKWQHGGDHFWASRGEWKRPSIRIKLGDYVNEKGRMDVLKFFEEHKKHFPTLWIIAQHEVAQQVVEVGCEQFFGLSGYISSPRRSRLGVRTYKHVAMLASIIQSVYIDNDTRNCDELPESSRCTPVNLYF